MNTQLTFLLSLAVYLVIGLLITYRYVTVELTELFEEELDETEDKEELEARHRLYDSFARLEHRIGRKGLISVMMAFGMIFWFPMLIYYKYCYWFRKE